MSAKAEIRGALLDSLLRDVERHTGAAGVREHRFHPIRRWRFDAAFPAQRVALEVDGGVWIQGRHTRGAGFLGDMEKLNEAALAGWRVLRVTWRQVENGEAHQLLYRALGAQK